MSASALAPLADLRATVFVGSLREAEEELRQSGWAMEGPLGAGASLLARDPDRESDRVCREPRRGAVSKAELAGAGPADLPSP